MIGENKGDSKSSVLAYQTLLMNVWLDLGAGQLSI